MQFKTLQLPPGTAMKLVVPGAEQGQQVVHAQYIGCHAPHSVVAAVMSKAAGPLLRAGVRVAASAVTPTGIVSFAATVEAVGSIPFAYVHLSYPASISLRSVRAAVRVDLELPARITNLDAPDNLEAHPAQILDMSVRGLRFGSATEIGRVGDELSIHARLAFDDIQRDITLSGKIRSHPLRTDVARMFAHVYGVEFTALDDDKRVLLHAFVLNMVQSHGAQM